MKKFCYILSIAGHALVLLIILNTDFPITIQPERPALVVVRIAEPPPPYIAEGVPPGVPPGTGSSTPRMKTSATRATTGLAPGVNAGLTPSRSTLAFPTAGEFNLRSPSPGSFRLAPVGKNPDPWATPLGPEAPPRPLRNRFNVYRPGTALGGGGGAGGIFMVPFNIREKTVAEWTQIVLARIERNWIIPILARVAYSGRVQITLTIEKNGRQHKLAMEDSTLPESLALSALHAVQASLPLPPLPENVFGETFAFTFVFTYNG
jgi:outer membrane biosynthesis protein TonB